MADEYSDCGVLQKNICQKRGDRPTHRFFLYNAAGTLVDVAGLTAELSVNPDNAPDDTADELFSIAGVPSSPTSLGYFDFTPSALQADQIPDVYFYDVEVIGASKPLTIAEGTYTFEPDITNAGA